MNRPAGFSAIATAIAARARAHSFGEFEAVDLEPRRKFLFDG
jgi:hypothetical protein